MAFIFSEDEPSGDIEYFLANIEQFVREGRPPLRIGRIGSAEKGEIMEMHPYYQVPPKGFNPDNISDIYDSMGTYVFVDKFRVHRRGSTYILTEEQAQEVETRVEEELKRLGKSKGDVIHSE